MKRPQTGGCICGAVRYEITDCDMAWPQVRVVFSRPPRHRQNAWVRREAVWPEHVAMVIEWLDAAKPPAAPWRLPQIQCYGRDPAREGMRAALGAE
jgi:hypothetical protein